jgi:hypothetical protein
MRVAALPTGALGRVLAALVALALLGAVAAGLAWGERTQKGDLIVRLDGGLSPLKLPRNRPAPVAVHLEGGLKSAGGELLPRVTRIELGLPAQGVVSTRGLPTCSQQQLRNARPPEALAACRSALVGRGRLAAQVKAPNQAPFAIHTRLLAFNGRTGGRRAVLLHAFAADPPTVAVIPVELREGSGRFGLALVADLPRALGPWPRFADFDLTLSRRYSYRGKRRSYLSASCPIPRRLTAGFFSLARVELTLAGGSRIATGIARSCRAR